MIYANGVSVPTKLTKQLKTISSDLESDRTYVNAYFHIVFLEDLLLERIEKGLSRENVLAEFRESERYKIMKGFTLVL